MSCEHLVLTFFKCPKVLTFFKYHILSPSFIIHSCFSFWLRFCLRSSAVCPFARLRDDKIGPNRINLANAELIDLVARIKFRPDTLPESIHISSDCVSHAKYFMHLK